ncbi:hypothetical protein RFI_22463 [Reticulomyxa filosa]|uniref:Uncharacterized protein n=1 Tax=Reticulomyxa filosa TaxID=46433 RepID=X6MM56_RETFI|nr:hypothetical protein RFI_22463 [Reticulomyxa filosa]|eukprot:ETO14904.1 hypothetical protein RFI_22463 [Reticulomyxa filosa]
MSTSLVAGIVPPPIKKKYKHKKKSERTAKSTESTDLNRKTTSSSTTTALNKNGCHDLKTANSIGIAYFTFVIFATFIIFVAGFFIVINTCYLVPFSQRSLCFWLFILLFELKHIKRHLWYMYFIVRCFLKKKDACVHPIPKKKK